MLLCGIDSQHQTETIYAQILAEELGTGRGIFVTRFNPNAVKRQSLLDFCRTQTERYVVIIGSSELLTLRFPMFDRVTDKWTTVTKANLLSMMLEDENPQ
jgi:hypothetical protein